MRLLISLFALPLLTACAAHTATAPSPPKPSWHWEWAGGKGGGTSEQFSKDNYACLQDYRMTQSPTLQLRDALTELRFMNLHTVLCLRSKGWEKVQDAPYPTLTEALKTPTSGAYPSGAYWTPNGWYPLATGKKAEWFWKGPPVEEMAATTRFQSEKEACFHDAGVAFSPSSTPTDEQLNQFFGCMLLKSWAMEPVPAPENVPRQP